MATYHVKSAAAGGGSGSSASPWTLQEAFDNAVAGDDVRIWADGTYDLGSTTINVDTNSGAYNNPIQFSGANGSDGSIDGTRADIRATSGNTYCLTFSLQSGLLIQNLKLNGNNRDAITGSPDNCVFSNLLQDNANSAARLLIETASRCVFIDCAVTGGSTFLLSTGVENCTFIGCLADGVTGDGFGSSTFRASNSFHYCTARDTGGDGFSITNSDTAIGAVLHGCIADGCGDDGFLINSAMCIIESCIAYGNTGDGLATTGTAEEPTIVRDSVFVANGGYGINHASTGAPLVLSQSYQQGNTSGGLSGTAFIGSLTALSGNPFTNAASSDFSIDNTSGEGATLRALSYALPSVGTTWYPFGFMYDGTVGGGGIFRRVPRMVGAS